MIHDPQLRIRAAALSGARRSRPPRHRLRKARCHPADRGHYIGVVLDEDPKKRIGNYHPTHEMQYGEMAERLPLKEWLVLPLNHDWDDLTWNREARQDLVTAWAAPRSQARYKAYERPQDCCTASRRCCTSKSGAHKSNQALTMLAAIGSKTVAAAASAALLFHFDCKRSVPKSSPPSITAHFQ